VRIERIEDPRSLRDRLLDFVFEVYKGTGGRYPALEWVEEKPSPDDFEGFRRAYEPFLRFRLEEEFDELYVMGEGEIIGTVALVYNLRGKDLWWVPDDVRNGTAGFVEFLMVRPELRGRGYGGELLRFAVRRLRGLGKVPHVVTFSWLEAYTYYLRRGFTEVLRRGDYVVLRYEPKDL